MKQTVRGTWNFVGKPAALAQGCASEAHLKHGCEYAPVAGRIRNFIEILSAPCRLAVASASGGQCRYPVKAGGKTVYYKQNAYLRTIGHFLLQKKTSLNGSNNCLVVVLHYRNHPNRIISNRRREDMEGKGRITGHTGLLALIGSPVGHSGSPAMYNYSFEKLGLDYAYVAFDIKVEEVKAALDAMRLFHMRGCNVTMPCKTEAAKYMDELSPAARIIGAVNTIVNEDGKLIGHMTDGEGFVGNLRDHGIEIKGKKITVAGGGGAATAIQVQCALDGAREISIFNIKDDFFERTLETAEKIRKEVPGIVVNVYDIADTAKMTEEIQSSDIFANATIVGMKPMEKESVVKDTSAFRPGLVVADAVYNPEETRLLREAKEAGCTCLNGKGMLLWQGVAAFRLYTGEEMPVQEVKEKFFQ